MLLEKIQWEAKWWASKPRYKGFIFADILGWDFPYPELCLNLLYSQERSRTPNFLCIAKHWDYGMHYETWLFTNN